jgi:hypothetical protein
MKRFKLWYENSAHEVDTIEEWNALPYDNLVSVVEFCGIRKGIPNATIIQGSDWYWMTPEGNVWRSGNTNDIKGIWNESDCPANCYEKKALWVSDERFEEIRNEIREWIHGA